MAAVGGRVKSVEQNCKPCLNKHITRPADVFCSTCTEFQCNECSNSHAVFAFMRDHTLLTVSEGVTQCDGNDDITTESINMNGLDICEKHQKPIEFYCKKDKALACSSCAILDHRKCTKVVDLATVAKGDKCFELRDKLRSAILSTKQAVENIQEAVIYVNSQPQPIHEQLTLIKKNMNELFDEFGKKVTNDAEGYRKSSTSVWDRQKTEFENKIKTMELSMETVDTVATKGTQSQQFIVAHCLQESIQKEAKKAESCSADVRGLNVRCSYNEQFEALKVHMLSALKPGELEINYIVVMSTKLKPIASIQLKQTHDNAKEPLYSGLDFLPDGRIVALDNKNAKCLIYDQNLRLKSVYKLPFQTCRCLVVVADEEIAITAVDSESVLAFLRVTKLNETTLIRKCSLKAQYFSISLQDGDNFAVGAVNQNNPVRIVSMSGEEKDFDITFPSKKYSVSSSYCTYIRGRDKVVLTDRDADKVFIYDTKTRERVEIKDELIKAPDGLAVGPYNRMFVGSVCSRSSLVEITPFGRVVSSHEVGMQYPRYIAISKDGTRLAVSNSCAGDKRLSLFEMLHE